MISPRALRSDRKHVRFALGSENARSSRLAAPRPSGRGQGSIDDSRSSGHFLPALVTACEGWFWLRSLIMLFAEAVCKPFDERETLWPSDAGQRAFPACPASSA